MMAKFALWLNNNLATQDALKIPVPVPLNFRLRKIEFGLKEARNYF